MQGHPRKALQIIDDATIGGGQRHVLWLSEGLRSHGWEVEVACAREGWLVDELRARGIARHAVEMSNRPSLSTLGALREVLKRVDPGVVHTHGSTAGFYGRLAARIRGGTAVVHTYHGLHYLHERPGPRRAIFEFVDGVLAGLTDRIICVSDSDRRLALGRGLAREEKTVVVKIGIDPGPFSEIPQRPMPLRPMIGTIGRLHPQKGHAYLIDALKLLHDDGIPAEVEIVGEGDLRGSLTAQIAKCGLSSAARLLGAQTDAPALLSRFDVFVLPSLWEGLPYVLLEAMAAARPIVASNVDGVAEAVTDGEEGILVRAGDPAALADGLRRALGNPARAFAMGKRAGERVRREFDVSGMIQRIVGVYEDAMHSARPGKDAAGR